jgi:hypothetical protein
MVDLALDETPNVPPRSRALRRGWLGDPACPYSLWLAGSSLTLDAGLRVLHACGQIVVNEKVFGGLMLTKSLLCTSSMCLAALLMRRSVSQPWAFAVPALATPLATLAIWGLWSAAALCYFLLLLGHALFYIFFG